MLVLPLPAAAQQPLPRKDVHLHDSPLILRGAPFDGAEARTTLTEGGAYSQRTWSAFVTRTNELAMITLNEMIGEYYIMTRPRVRELFDPLLKQPSFAGASWGAAGTKRVGLGTYDYQLWTYSSSTAGKQFCVAFVNYFDSAESGGWKRRLQGVYCGPREAGDSDLENGFRVLGVKGRYEPPPGASPRSLPPRT